MKKLLLSVCACLCMATAAFAQNAAKNVSGTYTGDLYISMGAPIDLTDTTLVPIPDQSIQITPSQTDSVSSIDFSLPNFALGELVLGDINLPGIGVVAGDSVYSFAPNAPQSLTFLPGTDDQIDALVSINDSTSSIKNSEAVINIDVIWVMSEDSQMPIYVAFVGKKTVDAGISQIATTETKATGIYTLTGVRVNTTDVKSLPKGIYIVNGKKQIVK